MGHRLDLPLLIGLRSRMATFATHPILAGSSGGWIASRRDNAGKFEVASAIVAACGNVVSLRQQKAEAARADAAVCKSEVASATVQPVAHL